MPVIPDASLYSVALSGSRIVKRALRVLGSTSSGEEPSADELADGIEALNDMLDTWNSEEFTVPAMTTYSFALTSGTQTYTIGPGCDFDMPRPRQIVDGEAMAKLGSLEYPLHVYTRKEWAEIALKTLVRAIPVGVFYDNDSATGQVSFFPIPGADYFNLYIPKLLAQISNASDVFYLPPAYSEAIKYGLALRLWGEYPNPNILPYITEMAASTKASAKRPNSAPDTMDCELTKINYPDGWINSAAFQRGL